MKPRSIATLSALFLAAVAVTPLAAQPSTPLRVDFTAGLAATRGGFYDLRVGVAPELLLTHGIRRAPVGQLVAGLSGGFVYGGGTLRCVVKDTNDMASPCAPHANFNTIAALFGVERGARGAALRILGGPTWYDGDRDNSLGLRGRIDIATPPIRHIALTLTTSGTYLPDQDHARVFVGGLSMGLSIR